MSRGVLPTGVARRKREGGSGIEPGAEAGRPLPQSAALTWGRYGEMWGDVGRCREM